MPLNVLTENIVRLLVVLISSTLVRAAYVFTLGSGGARNPLPSCVCTQFGALRVLPQKYFFMAFQLFFTNLFFGVFPVGGVTKKFFGYVIAVTLLLKNLSLIIIFLFHT